MANHLMIVVSGQHEHDTPYGLLTPKHSPTMAFLKGSASGDPISSSPAAPPAAVWDSRRGFLDAASLSCGALSGPRLEGRCTCVRGGMHVWKSGVTFYEQWPKQKHSKVSDTKSFMYAYMRGARCIA
eukprot:452221-Pelagomonas_calceolata.AAC.6